MCSVTTADWINIGLTLLISLANASWNEINISFCKSNTKAIIQHSEEYGLESRK